MRNVSQVVKNIQIQESIVSMIFMTFHKHMEKLSLVLDF